MKKTCNMIRAAVRTRGFTIIELLTVVAVMSVLMMVAAPNFTEFQRNSALTSTTNTLVASLNAARSEAMKRGAYAMVVPADPGRSDWNQGWVVFVDKDLSMTLTGGDEVVMEQAAPPAYMQVAGSGTASGATPYVLYNGSGYSRERSGAFAALTLSLVRTDVPAATAYQQTRRVVVSPTGRVRSCRPESATDANCATSSTN